MFLKIANTVYDQMILFKSGKSLSFQWTQKLDHFAFCFDINAPVFCRDAGTTGRKIFMHALLALGSTATAISVLLLTFQQSVVLIEGRLIPRSAVGIAGTGSHVLHSVPFTYSCSLQRNLYSFIFYFLFYLFYFSFEIYFDHPGFLNFLTFQSLLR